MKTQNTAKTGSNLVKVLVAGTVLLAAVGCGPTKDAQFYRTQRLQKAREAYGRAVESDYALGLQADTRGRALTGTGELTSPVEAGRDTSYGGTR